MVKQSKLEMTSGELEAVKAKNTEYQSALDSLNLQLETRLKEKTQVSSELEEAKQRLAQVEEKLEELHQKGQKETTEGSLQLKAAKERIAQIEAQLEDLQEKENELSQFLSHQQKEFAEKEKAYKASLEHLSQRHQEGEERAVLETKIKELGQLLGERDSIIRRFEDQLTRQQEEFAEKEREYRQSVEQLAQHPQQEEEEEEEEKTALEAKIKELGHVLSERDTLLRTKEDQLLAIRAELSELEAKYNEQVRNTDYWSLSWFILSLFMWVQVESADAFMTEASTSRKLMKQLEDKFNAVSQTNKDLTHQISQLQHHSDELDTNLATLKQQLSLVVTNSELKTQDLAKSLSQAQTQLTALAQQRNQAREC